MPDLNYLCIENIYEGQNSFYLTFYDSKYSGADATSIPNIEYSLDDGTTWTTYVFPTAANDTRRGPVVTIDQGGKCYFRGDNPETFGSSYYCYCHFTVDQIFNVSGNIMSLLDKTCQQTTFPAKCTLGYLFQNTPVVSAKNLLLPALNLNSDLCEHVYRCMFEWCASLTTAPELPATTLSKFCYYYMFSWCTSLEQAPKLPAAILADYCYGSMFNGCQSLTIAPELPATTLSMCCYDEMFHFCDSLTTAPELPATTLKDYCYNSMFRHCTSLTTAPDLLATSLNVACYSSMFSECTNLVFPPRISAITLASGCCLQMFQGCTNLRTLPELPAKNLVGRCYENMFSDCSSLKMFTEYQEDKQCIFRLSVDTSHSAAVTDMFKNVPNMPSTPEVNTDYYISLSPQIINKKYKLSTTFVENPVWEAKVNFMSNGRVFSSISIINDGKFSSQLFYDSTPVASISGINWVNANITWVNNAYQTLILYNGVDTSKQADFSNWLFKNSYQIEETIKYNLIDYARQHQILPGEYNIKTKVTKVGLQDSEWSDPVNYSFISWISQKFGSEYIKDLRFGTDEVKKLYFGDVLIYTSEYKQ